MNSVGVGLPGIVPGRGRRWPGRLPALSILVLVLLPALGWAHALLIRSTPAARSALTKAPDRVSLWFNEPLEPAFSRLSVWNAGGTQVDLGDVVVAPDEPTKLSVGLGPLTPGAYVVKYRVLSVDGHVVESRFSFTLRGPRP